MASGIEVIHRKLRADRLRSWINSHTTQAEFARSGQVSRQYIAKLLADGFGYDTARSIEARWHIPLGSLDGEDAMVWMQAAAMHYLGRTRACGSDDLPEGVREGICDDLSVREAHGSGSGDAEALRARWAV